MPLNKEHVENIIAQYLANTSAEDLAGRLTPKTGRQKPSLTHASVLGKVSIASNWEILQENTAVTDLEQALIADDASLERIECYANNIENCIGTVKLPVGIAGPLRVNGAFAQDDFYLPLATTEAALVASYNRGARLITEAGGCTVMVLSQAITRAPGFIFQNLIEVSRFVRWLHEQFPALKQAAEASTRYGRLMDLRTTVEGNHVYLNFDYTTGDASGQNMVTIATAEILKYITEHSPVIPKHSFVEANFSGDKKSSTLSYLSVRGKKVCAEVCIEARLIEQFLHTTPQNLARYWQLSALGGVMSGTMGVQGHYANGLAALYLATGQDVACVAESSVGVTRLEVTENGGLYASVTLPNIVVGTVGGGTKLPSQAAALTLLGLQGGGQALAFAEVCAATCLAGELSIMGALCAGDFTSAHQRLARGNTAQSGL